MLPIWNAFRRTVTHAKNAKVLKHAKELRASISTGPQQQHGTYYEIRSYCIKPEHNTTFLKLLNEKIHLRTAHSELVGFWTGDYGAFNQVFHIWKYDSYGHRTRVRAAVATDPQWQEQFISKVLPMLVSQEVEAAYLVPWSEIQKPAKKGVYELVTFQMKPGGPAVWGKAFQVAISARTGAGYSHLVGVFHSEFGLLNRVHVLWWYESPDQRAAIRHTAHQDARVVAAVRESVSYLESQSNKLLLPTPFSPLQ
ncbi:protein NipSnap homolog 3A-like [Paramormyrops kingsleyae]|uniref:Nipsnap homolog 3A (C. elegans) n=1 Tax=Paramormyrops kingsleyae TaxID=1676925 RepID=A0A3B3QQZ0_9TELE|nr:protein NipSnap homolog 3A-like [Paramormyrops kingsleyae]